ncbi:hypothetical protein EVAR_60402_1 [Eumeta japonica]|uniref:Uncharacterized protein n=1 Tax=Eumeta variegata TaxID=151549 RepID=A0A4C1YRA6_EUMVA|nr:hypothetical protein EVAR_60402_1 [Eumeta japonica]
MRSLRDMCGVSRKDRCRKSGIRERCGLKGGVVTRVERHVAVNHTVADWLQQRTMDWFGRYGIPSLESGYALVTPLGLRMFMGTGDLYSLMALPLVFPSNALVLIRASFVESYHEVNTKRRCLNAKTRSRHESPDCGAKRGDYACAVTPIQPMRPRGELLN